MFNKKIHDYHMSDFNWWVSGVSDKMAYSAAEPPDSFSI